MLELKLIGVGKMPAHSKHLRFNFTLKNNVYTARASIQKGSKYLAPIARTFREIGMNMKVGGSNPSKAEAFSVS